MDILAKIAGGRTEAAPVLSGVNAVTVVVSEMRCHVPARVILATGLIFVRTFSVLVTNGDCPLLTGVEDGSFWAAVHNPTFAADLFTRMDRQRIKAWMQACYDQNTES
jgi:hypothetical protein